MVVSFTVLIVLQSSNLWKEFAIDSSGDLILLYTLSSLNFVAFCVFAFVFLRSIIRLMRERRTFQMGAQIKTKLLVYFFAVSLMPIIAMAIFSYLFMNRALDRWFTQIPQSIIQQARSAEPSPAINASLAELDRLSQQQVTIRRIGLLTLGILTFLLIFASSWIAFYVARGLTEPIRALAEGAEEIAKGNLGHRVDVFAEDELALLVSTFNEMSATLESTSLALRERRRYIEAVLETLPTGVISFDADDKVTTINRAAVTILRLAPAEQIGTPIDKLVGEHERMSFTRLLARARRVGHGSDQMTIKADVDNGNGFSRDVTVALSATKLPTEGGVVLVIEDLSELIAAQRAFAWQEVARRMAHEIKNPLTPIQLSAERIAKRFAETGHIDVAVRQRITDKGPIGDVVHESTATILREVTSLKSMVDEFSRFARLPATQLEGGDLNDAIRKAVATFDALPQGVRIDVSLNDLPNALIDAEKMRQVFINLIQNAVEALERDDTDARVTITSRFDSARDLIVAEVADNGRGIAPSDLQRLFQPYFSTKGRGTGLGLAIVHRIIMEHNGRIHAAQNQPRGAKFIIELPANA